MSLYYVKSCSKIIEEKEMKWQKYMRKALEEKLWTQTSEKNEG